MRNFQNLFYQYSTVDSGATHSDIKQSVLPDCKLGGRFIQSVGAAGVTVKERFATPLRCIDEGDTSNPFVNDLRNIGLCYLQSVPSTSWAET